MTSVSGYSQLPDFLQRLSAGGFEVVAQARASPSLSRLAAFGVFPACQGQTRDEALETLIRARRLSPKRLGVIYRSVRPEASLDQFATFLRSHTVGGALALHRRTAQLYVSGFQLLCGGRLIIGRFVPEYRALSQAALNDVIAGAIVVIVSLLETWALVRPPLKAA